MAKLVSVCRSDNYPFERRQIPLVVDESLTMVMQFGDSCTSCNQTGFKQKDLERFMKKFGALSSDEVAAALMTTSKDVLSLLAQMVPCVGCRRSVERLFTQLVKSGHPAVEPLVISSSAYLSIKRDYLFDPKAIYALFYVHGTHLNTMMDSLPKSKKNKRCILHSLDTHKVKTLGTWIDVWEVLSSECREEVIVVECDNLKATLESYLRKHRFCTECKGKVLRAYELLISDQDKQSEKGYCPALYENLRCCPSENHIHVSSKTEYIAQLIGRAEPELTGSRRERHAKTLDIAQEEVLTCLGIYLYERLHKIWQKLRAEEQTWQILFYVGVDSLKKSFEMALERKQGVSNLELMCQEILEEEEAQEARRQQKRQKRRRKKNKNTKVDTADLDMEDDKDKENCQCDENTNISSAICAACDDHNSNRVAMESSPCRCDSEQSAGSRDSGLGNRSDCGYSSGPDGCDSCGFGCSHDGSDVGCSEGLCNHDGDSPLCNRVELQDLCGEYCSCSCEDSPTHVRRTKRGSHTPDVRGSCPCTVNDMPKYCMSLSLQDMLEASCSSGEEDDRISEEEIQRFRANQTVLDTKRQELRATLRQRFAKMTRNGCCVHQRQPQPVDNVTSHITKLSMN